jgi:RHS repeat-associated protein
VNLRAAKQEAEVSHLAAFCLLAENSHRGHRLPAAILHRAFAPVNSNTTTGFQAFLYDSGRRSRSTGKERDAETGLDYFGARYFSGAEGRFASPDWSAKPQPVPYASLTDPQTLNLYGYVRNNPMARADADGHCWPLCTILAGAAIGAAAGAGAEYLSERFQGKPTDVNKILHAAAGGALSGGIAGLAGPEAGLGLKLLTSVAGSLIGGKAERQLNAKDGKPTSPGSESNSVLTDVVAGVVSAATDGIVDRKVTSPLVKKAVTAASDTARDSASRTADGLRESGSESSGEAQEQNQQQQQPQPQEEHTKKPGATE